MSPDGERAGEDRAIARARRLLMRPDGWIEAVPGGYGLRGGQDRRTRLLLTLDEAGFRRLVADPGLKARPGGGWTRRSGAAAPPPEPPCPGRPGVIEGERVVMEADGRLDRHRANLGHSAVAWLAGRRDAEGRPWLDAGQVAAAARLAMEAEAASAGPSLTMRWDALPRAGGGSAARVEPSDRMLAAGRRVEAALAACGPARGMVEHICIRASALQAAERNLGLRRREGRALLQSGLRALAAYYRIGWKTDPPPPRVTGS